MHLFDADDKLKKYDTVEAIIDDYFETRLELYVERKAHLINVLERTLLVLSNKARYIQELLDDTIDLRKRKRSEIIDLLLEKEYAQIDEDGEYKYLIKMPMDSVSEENVDKLNRDHKDKLDELLKIKETTEQQMWLVELDHLEQEYHKYRAERSNLDNDKKKVGSKIVAKAGSVKKVVKKSKTVVELDLIEE
jgi:DNA topoisomerase-2